MSQRKMNGRTMVKVAMLGAVETVLMIFEITLWFAQRLSEID